MTEKTPAPEPPSPPQSGPPRPTFLTLLQTLSFVLALTFFGILFHSAFFPSKSLVTIDAETGYLEFTVAPDHRPTIRLRNVVLNIGNREEQTCVTGVFQISEGAHVRLEHKQSHSLTISPGAPDPSGQPGPSGTLSQSTTARTLTEEVRIYPFGTEDCPDDLSVQDRISLFPVTGAGSIGAPFVAPPGVAAQMVGFRPSDSTLNDSDPQWINGGVKLLTESLLCRIRQSCPMFNVSGGEFTIPSSSRLSPVDLPLWDGFAWLPFIEEEAPRRTEMYGVARLIENGYSVGVTAEAQAIEVRLVTGERPRIIRSSVLEQALSEPFIAALLSLGPTVSISLAILNRDGPGPRSLFKWLVRLVLRRPTRNTGPKTPPEDAPKA